MKKTKLLTSLAALALVLSLGACEVNVDVGGVDVDVDVDTDETTKPDEGDGNDDDGNTSDTGDEGGDTGTGSGDGDGNTGDTGEGGGSTEITSLSNYTLSIGIQYGDQLVEVPEYATAYIEGGWDSWTQFVALTPSADGRYEYTFASIAPGTYEYQLVLAYNDGEPGWTYRITQDGENASFTVNGSEGDDYKNEVTVTSSKALSEIIPDPNAAISNVKVTIDITYNGTSQSILDYGTLWIEGSWDWSEGFVACTVEDGKYVYTFDSLAPIEYEFLGVVYYSDEDLPTEAEGLWSYKVNGSDNCKFTVSDASVSATLVATQPLANILPEKSGETPEEDEDIELASEIIESILDNDVDWNAYHGEVDDDGEYDVVDFALDENSNTYGRRLSYEDEELYEEVFYQDGTAYWHDLEEDDPEDAYYTSTTVPSISSYFESNFADALDEAEDIDFDDDDYTLDALEYLDNGGYKVVVGYSYTNFYGQTTTGTFTYVVDSSYRLTELGYEYNAVNSTTTEYAKEITLDDVKEIMDSEFDINLWIEDEEEDETLVGTLTFLSANTSASTTAFSTSTLQTCLTKAYSGTGTITAGETGHTYPGSNGSGNGLKGDADCIQLGGSKDSGHSFAFSLSGTDQIVKLVVKVVYYDSQKNMTINENAISIGYNSADYSSWDDVPETVYTLEATTSFDFSVSTSSNRMLIHSIELYSA